MQDEYYQRYGGKNMGMFKKKVKVTNSKDPNRFFEEEFRVDTGAPLVRRSLGMVTTFATINLKITKNQIVSYRAARQQE